MAIDPDYIAQQIAKEHNASAEHQDFAANYIGGALGNVGYNTAEQTVSFDMDCAKTEGAPSILNSLRQQMKRLNTMARQSKELAELVSLIEKHPDFARMIELYRRYA